MPLVLMSSDTESFLSTPLLATAILIGVLSALLGQVGVILKTAQVSSWELLLQVGFVGGALSLLLGGAWAARVVWQYATGRSSETESG